MEIQERIKKIILEKHPSLKDLNVVLSINPEQLIPVIGIYFDDKRIILNSEDITDTANLSRRSPEIVFLEKFEEQLKLV